MHRDHTRRLVLVNDSAGRESRAQAKRKQILAGAQHVFLQQGFSATSTDAIASEAGVSKRTLYSYYPSKEELFADVMRKLTIENPQTQVVAFMRSMEPHSIEDLHGALVRLANKILSTMMDPSYLALMRTVIGDFNRFPQLSDIFRFAIPERAFKEGSAMIQRAQENGVVLEGDTEVMMRVFIGPLLSYVLGDGLFRPEGQTRLPTPENIEKIVDFYMKAISNVREQDRNEG